MRGVPNRAAAWTRDEERGTVTLEGSIVTTLVSTSTGTNPEFYVYWGLSTAGSLSTGALHIVSEGSLQAYSSDVSAVRTQFWVTVKNGPTSTQQQTNGFAVWDAGAAPTQNHKRRTLNNYDVGSFDGRFIIAGQLRSTQDTMTLDWHLASYGGSTG